MSTQATDQSTAAGEALAAAEQQIAALRAQSQVWRRRALAFEASARALMAVDTPTRLPAILLRLATELMDAEASSLALVEDGEGDLSFHLATGPRADKVRQLRLEAGQGIVGWVVARGESALVPDVSSDPRFRQDIAEGLGYAARDILCVPLHAREGVIGAIEVINKRGEQPFSEEDLRLLQPIATLAAAAVKNARLHEAFQKKMTELSTLTGVGIALSARLNLPDLLDTIVYLATSLLRAEASSLLLLNAQQDALEFVVALGAKGEEVKEHRVPLGQGIAGWVAQHGEPAVVPDVTEDPRFTGEIAEAVGFEVSSILCVPIKVQEDVIGVIELLNPVGDRPFDEDDVNILSILASQAGIAIRNAHVMQSERDLFYSTVSALAALIDADDPYTHGHSKAVASLCGLIAEEIGLSPEVRETLQLAALLHDIGKIGVDKVLINKAGDLTDQELEEIRAHPLIGANVLANVEYRIMQEALDGVRHHHEWYDGSGFPDHLAGEAIPLIARIICVADAYHAMVSARSYRPAREQDEALRELREWSGTQFWPEAVEALCSALERRREAGNEWSA
ncbi:MAG: GAF domain-containing protein [Armatimonadota bacterium]